MKRICEAVSYKFKRQEYIMEQQDNEFISKFNELRYHSESEVVEFKKAENNFDIDDLGK